MNTVRLSTVAKIDRTVASQADCQKLPYVGLEHLEKESGQFIPSFRPRPDTNLLAAKFKFTPKHILYGKLRPYLNKVTAPTFSGVCTTEILPILVDDDQLSRGYLYAVLRSPTFVEWASAAVSGANLPRLDPKQLAQYEIPFPPLTEQKRIAAILDKADRLRRQRRFAQTLSDSFLQSVFIKMFGDPVANTMNWSKEAFDKVCKTRLGKMLDEKRETGLQNRFYLRNTNVKWSDFDLGEVNQMDFDEKERKEFRLVKGDILICEGGEIGRSAIWNDQLPECYFQKALHRARPHKDKVVPEFIVHLMWALARRNGFAGLSSQATIAHLTGEKLAEMNIVVPPLPLQEKFAAIVQKFERIRRQQREATRQAEHLFQTLLHRAFRGAL